MRNPFLFVSRWGGCSQIRESRDGQTKKPVDRLSTRDAEAIIRDALSLRRTVLSSQLHLKAHGELYWQLSGLVDKLHEVMASLANKEPDYRMPGLGLLPLPEDYLTRK